MTLRAGRGSTSAARRPLPASAAVPASSVAFVGGGVAATAVYLLLPRGGLGQALVFVLLSGAAVVALAKGVRRQGLDSWPWRLLVASGALYVTARVGWYLLPVTFGVRLAYPSALDALVMLAYLGWAVVLVDVSRRRSSTDPGLWIDAVVAGLALAIVAWLVVIEPAALRPSLALSARVVSTMYPLLLLVVSAVAVRLVLLSERTAPVDVLLVAWVTLELAGGLWYSAAEAEGTFRYGHPWFAAWLLSYAALGAMASHPDLGRLSRPSQHDLASPAVRAVVLGASLVVAVAGLAGLAEDGLAAGAIAATAALMVALAVLRLMMTTRDLRTERRLRTELERVARDLEHAATHDALTGVANRMALDAFLPRALARRRRPGRSAVVLVLDLHAFKAVNDTYGHRAGDELLSLTGARLAALVGSSGLVARLGGDEFAVVVGDGDARTGVALAERIGETLAQPASIGSATVLPAVSIGVHTARPGDTPGDALLCADAALCAAKASSARYELFDVARHRRFIERYQIELDLRAAPTRDELVLHYQPVLDLSARRVVGAEALVRWHHPVRGLLHPGDFIEVAEESGAIVDVGRWVLQQACRDAHRWQGLPGGAGVEVAVNLSRRQLQNATVVDDVRRAIEGSELGPGLLTLEVTETALMSDTAEMVSTLHEIRDAGVDIAMDDFGTGYSSLSHLRTLPVDVLKIDKAFVDGIAKEDEEWALAAAIIRLAGSLGKRTLAEGIERASQLAHLRTLGCELGQGWLFAPAMPFDNLIDFLAAGSHPDPTGGTTGSDR